MILAIASARRDSNRPALRIMAAAAGIALAVSLRAYAGGAQVATSLPAAFLFATALGFTALLCENQVHPRRMALRHLLFGAGGAALLIVPALASDGLHPVRIVAPALWFVVTGAVAWSEEWMFRGRLWQMMRREGISEYIVLLVTSILFAVIHAPLYGWHAVPIDLAVGMLLGSLRMISGSFGASATAHLLADYAAGVGL